MISGHVRTFTRMSVYMPICGPDFNFFYKYSPLLSAIVKTNPF
jgi:hypothetical protein